MPQDFKNKEPGEIEKSSSESFMKKEGKIEMPGENIEKVEQERDETQEQLIRQELEREIELIRLDDNLKKIAEDKVKKIGSLDEEAKLEHLLLIAKERGVAFAIKVARDMNDPYILDTFHDLLARGGYYTKFLK